MSHRLFLLSALLLVVLLHPFVAGLSQSTTLTTTTTTTTTTNNNKANDSASSSERKPQPRRSFLSSILATTTTTTTVVVATTLGGVAVPPAWSRAPGSKDLYEAIEQIRGASRDLKTLQQNWDMYAVIDQEGRSVGDSTVMARRILGGVGPLAGDSAIAVAKATPLYRIDGAFAAVRKAAIANAGDDDPPWISELDLLAFEELSERIQFALQKADGDFYSVAFASKGSKQINGIFKEAKAQVDQGILDFEAIMGLLKEAGAPGLL
jgi:hypothetical protein